MSIARRSSSDARLGPPRVAPTAEPPVATEGTRVAAQRPGAAVIVLVAGAALTAFVIALMFLDPARAWFWELVHWDVSAATGTLAVAVSLRGKHGLVRQVGYGSLMAMALWLASNVVWTILALQGPVTFPTLADAFAILWIVPGGWMLVLTMRGRMGRAAISAVYLDDAIVAVATVSVLLAIFGPTAYFVGGAAGLLIAIYPAIFIGAAAMSFVSVFATRQPLRLEGGVAFAIGTGLMGIGYCTWVVPAVTGAPLDHAWATTFSIGPLIVSYGAISWRGPTTLPAHQERLAAMVGWTIGPIGVLVTAIAGAAGGVFDPLDRVLFGLTFLAAALLIVRFALHLHERTTTLAQVRALAAENERLIERLRVEAQERERVHARLTDASRMSAVGELAAAVAHEVNNPLTGVLGYSDLLLADPDLSPVVRQDLLIVRAEAMRVRDRVRMLIDFATPRRPDDVEVDLGQVVAAPLALLRYHLERRGLMIEERYPRMAPMLLDPAAIQQVLINVVTELASAMPSGGRLTVLTEPASDGASIILDASGQDLDAAAIRSVESPFDDGLPGDEPQGAIAASLGVLRGHEATLGIREATTEHIRIEIHLPRRASTRD